MTSNLLFVSSHPHIFKAHVKWEFEVPFLVVVLTGLIITLCIRWILHFWREKLNIHWESFLHLGRLTQYTAMIFLRMKDKALTNQTWSPTSSEGNSEFASPHLINGYPLGANTCFGKFCWQLYFFLLDILIHFIAFLLQTKIPLWFSLFLKGHTFNIICRFQNKIFSHGANHWLHHVSTISLCLILTFYAIFGSF